MATLIVQFRNGGSAIHQFAEEVVTIGRDPRNTIQIDDPSVSDNHAKLIFEQGRFHLRDLGLPPKSWIDGQPVAEAELRGTCAIRIGEIECIFKPSPTDGADKARADERDAIRRRHQEAVVQVEARAKEIAQLVKEREALKKTNETFLEKTAAMQREQEARIREIEEEHKVQLNALRMQLDASGKSREFMQAEIRSLQQKIEQQANQFSVVVESRDRTVEELKTLASALREKERLLGIAAAEDQRNSLLLHESTSKLEEAQRRLVELEAAEKSREFFQAEKCLLQEKLEQQANELSVVTESRNRTVQELNTLASALREKEQLLAIARAEDQRSGSLLHESTLKLEEAQRRLDEFGAVSAAIMEKSVNDEEQGRRIATLSGERDALARVLAERNQRLSELNLTLDDAITARAAAMARVASLIAELDERDRRISELTRRAFRYPWHEHRRPQGSSCEPRD